MAASTAVEKPEHGALPSRVAELVRAPYHDAVALRDAMRELDKIAFVIAPSAAFANIPPNVFITPVPVVIDPTFDPKDGRGTWVYHQFSFHKRKYISGKGEDAIYEPVEVSLNAQAINLILGSAGVDITASVRTDNTLDPNYCSWSTSGKVREFDGSWRQLPPGDVAIDLRDGSEQIGGWNADQWAEVERETELEKEDRKKRGVRDWWKVRGHIGNWSESQVFQQRRKILEIAQTKSKNRLGYNLGLQHQYAIADLIAKPFVIFRASWRHDMNNPQTNAMVTAAELGVADALFRGIGSASLPPVVSTAREEVKPEPPKAPAPPQGAAEIDDIPEPEPVKPAEVFSITRVTLLKDRYFFETPQGKTLTTTKPTTARALNDARKGNASLVMVLVKVVIDGTDYFDVVEFKTFKPSGADKGY